MTIEFYTTKSSMQELGLAFYHERRKRHLCLNNVAAKTHISEWIIDRIELGKTHKISEIKTLLNFYNKKIKIELVD